MGAAMMNMKVVRFACSNCGAGLQADARAVGYEVECPGCGEVLLVPESGAPALAPSIPDLGGKTRKSRPAKEEEPEAPAPVPPLPPPAAPQEKLQPKVKFCISCSKDVPEGDLICPHCGSGRFGRL